MWGKFLNYQRLPAESRATVNGLAAAIPSAILHLVELDRMRHQGSPAGHSTALDAIARQMDLESCKVLARLEDVLQRVSPVPQLTHAQGLLEDLHRALDELNESISDSSERRDAACRILAMIGQYGALHSAIAVCHVQPKKAGLAIAQPELLLID
jgi:hypothetical protein